eukprot:15471295-Alexandrium_andersonii.AAC.1
MERFHRLLEEGVRAMLLTTGLPHSFWPQACVVFCEHWNRAGRPGEELTPYLKRYGEEPPLRLFAHGQA